MVKAPSVIIAVILLCAVQDLDAFQWEPFLDVPPGSSIPACVGGNVTLPWKYTASANEHLIDVEWNFQANGHNAVLATSIQGNFVVIPGMHHELTFLPSAGLLITNMTSAQSGDYTVSVRFNLNGDAITESSSIHVDVYESCCEAEMISLRQEVTVLRRRVHQLESEAAIDRNAARIGFVAFLSAGKRTVQKLDNPLQGGKSHVSINQGGGFDERTGVFTAPVNGTYSFFTTAVTDSNFTNRDFITTLTGAGGTASVFAPASTNTFTSFLESFRRVMTAGDQVWPHSNGAGEFYPCATTFGGFLVDEH